MGVRTYTRPMSDHHESSEEAVELPPTRLFVGNLPFSMTDEELSEHFSTAGTVESAKIVRHGRSLGFGFVVFATETEAQNAIKEFNKTEYSGRTINVEVATSKPTPKKKRVRKPRKKTTRKPRRKPEYSDEEEEVKKPARRKNRRRRKPGKPKAKRAPRPKRAQLPPSDTSIFVANLPYSVEDEEFCALFEGLDLLEGHVAKTKKGKSKGFGFASFPSNEAQLKAIEAVKTMTVHERNLSAAPSTSPGPVTDDEIEEKEEKSEEEEEKAPVKKETPVKKSAPKKDAPKKETPKKDAPKKETPKKEAPKKESPKTEAKKEED